MQRTEMLLVQLMEECAEVQQACSKALRFGLRNSRPDEATSNSFNISMEVADLFAIVDLLEREDVMDDLRMPVNIQAKQRKVERFLEVSKDEGCLV